MIPDELRQELVQQIAACPQPREKAIDVMYVLQRHYGYLTDEAVGEAAQLLGMTPLEIDELATFYDFIYREPLGRHVIHVCDGVVCWMEGEPEVRQYLCRKLGVGIGETTPDGLFTILPTACLGDCHRGPSMLINGKFYGLLTPEAIDDILESLVSDYCQCVLTR